MRIPCYSVTHLGGCWNALPSTKDIAGLRLYRKAVQGHLSWLGCLGMSQRSRNLTLYRRAQGERQAHTKPTFRGSSCVKKIGVSLMPYLGWGILGGTLFYLGKVFKARAAEVAAIRMNATGGASLAIALLLTAIAHTWAVWVSSWIVLL